MYHEDTDAQSKHNNLGRVASFDSVTNTANCLVAPEHVLPVLLRIFLASLLSLQHGLSSQPALVRLDDCLAFEASQIESRFQYLSMLQCRFRVVQAARGVLSQPIATRSERLGSGCERKNGFKV